MLNDLRIEKLTRHGIALMQEERALALRGDFAALSELNLKKEEFLKQMNDLADSVESNGPVAVREARKQELETLFDIIKRRAEENQFLLRAAESGIKGAKRQILAIAQASESLGVYAANGEPIDNPKNEVRTSKLY